jgi:hypothetical protein
MNSPRGQHRSMPWPSGSFNTRDREAQLQGYRYFLGQGIPDCQSPIKHTQYFAKSFPSSVTRKQIASGLRCPFAFSRFPKLHLVCAPAKGGTKTNPWIWKTVNCCTARVYLYSLTRYFFLAKSVLVANPEQEVSRTKGRLSRGKSRLHLP